jgi:hypothetical protein
MYIPPPEKKSLFLGNVKLLYKESIPAPVFLTEKRVQDEEQNFSHLNVRRGFYDTSFRRIITKSVDINSHILSNMNTSLNDGLS